MSTTVACIPGFLAPQTVTGLTEKEASLFCTLSAKSAKPLCKNILEASSCFNELFFSILLIQNTRQQWIVICYISAAINVFGAIFYAVFASGVEQKWAKVEDVASYQTIYKHELQPDRKKKTVVVS